jgi:hypothetical protein
MRSPLKAAPLVKVRAEMSVFFCIQRMAFYLFYMAVLMLEEGWTVFKRNAAQIRENMEAKISSNLPIVRSQLDPTMATSIIVV